MTSTSRSNLYFIRSAGSWGVRREGGRGKEERKKRPADKYQLALYGCWMSFPSAGVSARSRMATKRKANKGGGGERKRGTS